MCVCASFQAKQAALTFSAQICPKVDLGLAIQKTVVGIRISILDIPCVLMFSQNEQLWIFRPKFVQKKFRVPNWEKRNVGIRINIVETLCVRIFSRTLTFLAQSCDKLDLSCKISGKSDNFDFFGPNLPKNEFWGRNFKNLSPDLESALQRYLVYQFSVKTDNFDFFGPN